MTGQIGQPFALTEGQRENLLCHLYVVFFAPPIELCGCGDPEAGVRLIHELLKLYDEPGLIYDTVGAVLGDNAGVQQVVLSLLGAAELTMCSTTLWSAYLLPRGKWVLWAVARLEQAAVSWADRLDSEGSGYPHNGHACVDSCWEIPK
ncbi:hypothetical protein [Actinosynnema sp. NPDC023587]|uniref:hypothetical protein n=1 Tax=Actinosynnema sp. NPDC023587 TaxID=3154695 RepID=UPI0033F61CB0